MALFPTREAKDSSACMRSTFCAEEIVMLRDLIIRNGKSAQPVHNQRESQLQRTHTYTYERRHDSGGIWHQSGKLAL